MEVAMDVVAAAEAKRAAAAAGTPHLSTYSAWDPGFWLCQPERWEDEAAKGNHRYVEYHLVYYPFAIALGLAALRRILERLIFHPLGQHFGLRHHRSRRAVPNDVLEAAYRANRKVGHKEIIGLSKQVDMEVRQVERWLRLRHRQGRPSVLDKFSESGWRCTFYTLAFLSGFAILVHKAWFWDLELCWREYPKHEVEWSVKMYYMTELGFYWSLFMSQFFDIKRKDFWQMFVHHLATILLLSISWTASYFRIGALIAFLHDAADIFLEGAKMTHYAKFQKTSIVLLGMFALVWIFSRLYVYPFWLLHSVIYDHQAILGACPVYCVLAGLLMMLQVLHIIWTYFILKVILETVTSQGKPKGDTRSCTSDNISTNEESSNSTSQPKTAQANSVH